MIDANSRQRGAVTMLASERAQAEGVPRRVFVKGMQGVEVTVIVTVVQGTVWLSISPPFTWEAIMEPGKVDELMHVLELARQEAKKMAAAHRGRASIAGNAAVRAITSG
jgi:Na+/proline symporter